MTQRRRNIRDALLMAFAVIAIGAEVGGGGGDRWLALTGLTVVVLIVLQRWRESR